MIVRETSCPGNVLSGKRLSGKVIVRETSVTPENTDVPLADEYAQIKDWAVKNWVKINTEKTKELVFLRPHPTKWHVPLFVEGIEQE